MKPACDGAELCVYTDGLNGTEIFFTLQPPQMPYGVGPSADEGERKQSVTKSHQFI